MKHLLLFGAVLISHWVIGQRVVTTQTSDSERFQNSLPENVIYYEGFENSERPNIPAGWSTQTLGSVGFVTGTSGSAAGQANENGFWAVPNHGIFAMSNDDVCNCDKSKDRLTSKTFDASSFNALTIEFSAFQNGSGGQTANIEIKCDGRPWSQLGEITSSLAWKVHGYQVPKHFLKSGFQFRFIYDDAGNYASGLAIDDVYLILGESENISFDKFFAINGNEPGSGQLFESIPLSQAREAKFQFGAQVNNSAIKRKNARLHVTTSGPIAYDQSSSDWMLSRESNKTIFIQSADAFTPYEKGTYSLVATLETDSTDSDLSDNSISTSFNVVDSVYSHVSHTAENSTGVWLQGSGDHYGSVFFFHQHDSIKAIKVRIHPSSEIGAKFKVEIFEFDSINHQPLYTSPILEVKEHDLGVDMRIPLNIEIQKGKHLISFRKEPGLKRLIIGVNKTKEALDSNVLYRMENEQWKQLPYFPKSSLIFKMLDTNCLGTIQYTLNNESCVGSTDGSVSLNPVGMNTPVSYSWSNFAGNTSTVTGLNPGTYIVTVSDASPCIYTKTFIINAATSLQVNPVSSPDSCGKQIGSVDLNISSGTAPYTVTWNSDTLSETESGLTLGQYNVLITDAKNCTLDTIIEVPGSEAIDLDFIITEPNCSANDGEVSATITGTAPFSLIWENGSTSNTRQNIWAGVYTLQVTDSLGCTISENAVVKNANAPSLVVSEANGPLCGNASSGNIILTVFGGTASYNFEWSNGSLDQNLSNLPSGNYQVTVSDIVDCLNFVEVNLADQSTPISASFNAKGVYCNDDSSGAADVVAIGGTMPYSYNWSNGNQVRTIENITSGEYKVTITDTNGCLHVDSLQISGGKPFFITFDSVVRDTAVSILPGNDVFISTYGGTEPYRYHWNDSIFTEDLLNVPLDTYLLTLTDQLGCEITFEYLLENGPAAMPELTQENSIMVYPNPSFSNDLITIKSLEPIDKILIRDINGKHVTEGKASKKTQATIALSGISSGLYLIEIHSDVRISTTVLIIN